MEELRPTSCPVCEGPASEVMPRHGDIHTISCPECDRYKISDTAVVTIEGLDPQGRRGKLEEAKRQAKAGELPIIFSF